MTPEVITDSGSPLDDRFIAKEMSRTEFQTMESFAPAYFAYMSSVVSANVSLLSLLLSLAN